MKLTHSFSRIGAGPAHPGEGRLTVEDVPLGDDVVGTVRYTYQVTVTGDWAPGSVEGPPTAPEVVIGDLEGVEVLEAQDGDGGSVAVTPRMQACARRYFWAVVVLDVREREEQRVRYEGELEA